jgi:hypothetical protein
MGINQSNLFPDLTNLAAELRAMRFVSAYVRINALSGAGPVGPPLTRAQAQCLPRQEGAAPGWGKLSTPLPTQAWPRAGPVTPSPLRSYAPAVKEMSAADDAPVLSRSPLRVSAERLVRFEDGLSRTRREARSTGPFMPALRRGTKGGDLCFSIGRCEGTLGSAPFRRLAELVGFGNTGMRDCATPNSTPLPLGERAQICCLIEPIG